jgi:prepilin-type processing-associated H-X9-DG protein
MPVWGWVLIGCAGCGCLGVVCLIFLPALLFPAFGNARSKARTVSCLSNLKQIGIANLMYAQDYDEQFPIASKWQEGTASYIKNDNIFHCPAVSPATAPSAEHTTYAFSSAMDRMKLSRLPDAKNNILTYESTNFNRNANDAVTSLPTPGRHQGQNNIGFADGHAKTWLDSEVLPIGKILPDKH